MSPLELIAVFVRIAAASKLTQMEEGTATTAVPRSLGPKAVELLGRLIQTNTVNPPGNERPAQEFLQEMLTAAGFECLLLEAERGRPNLVARLSGVQDGQ